MKEINRIIFVGQSGNSREPMAAEIFKDLAFKSKVEVLARGLVVQFPEPMNQKAEAVLISNGINVENFSSRPFNPEEVTEDTLVLTMEFAQRLRLIENFDLDQEQIQVLTDYVGDELEIIDPYGGTLQAYGLCYETLRKSIKKLVKKLTEESFKCQKY